MFNELKKMREDHALERREMEARFVAQRDALTQKHEREEAQKVAQLQH